MNASALRALESACPGGVLSAEADRVAYAYDAKTTGGRPAAVVLPETEEQVAAVLRVCADHRWPIVPRGAATGTTGAAVPGDGWVVLGLSRMDRVLEMNARDRYVRVQPGVVTADVQRAAEAAGLFYPPDPASAATCTIGGNVATGAGGLRAVKYGVTRDYVLGLTAVRVGGTVLKTGVLTLKGVVGYDLTRLLVGSEGTLAVITEAVLRLIAKPEARRTLLAGFGSVERACAAVGSVLSCGVVPDAIELMDEGTLAALRAHGRQAADGWPSTLLLIEVDGPAARIGEDAAIVRGVLEAEGAARVQAATSETESDALWSARRAVAPAVHALSRAKLSEDVTVPISRLPALVAGVREIAARHGLRHLSYGHAGDGNLHVNLLHDAADEERRARAAVSELFDLTLRLGGTISGEHGIGLTKRPFIGRELSPEAIQISRALKRVFDPDHLLNPGKVFPAP